MVTDVLEENEIDVDNLWILFQSFFIFIQIQIVF